MIECNKCNRTDLKMADMVKDKSIARGHKPLCKQCKAAAKRDIPKINKDVFIPMTTTISPRQRRNFGGDVYTGPRVRHPDEALPWSISKMAGVYVPEQANHRADNKHIKSFGTLC